MLFLSSEDKDDDNNKGFVGLLVVLSIIFLPAFILGWGYYSLIRFFKQRFSVIATVVLFVDLIAVLYGFLSHAVERALGVFANLFQIQNLWTDLIPFAIVFNIILGGFFGLLLVFIQIQQIKASPYKLKFKGTWLYEFKFRRTPLQYFRKKKIIEGLKEGKYSSPEKAPLGLDENNGDVVASMYGSESGKPTLISGAAGSGKTITMLSMIHNNIKNGKPSVVIDFKRSPELSSKLASWAKENNRKFYHFVNGDPDRYDVKDSPGQACYDALINGDASKADMVLGMREYDVAAEVYKSSMRQLLQVLFSMLKYADKSKAPNVDWDHGELYQVASSITGGNFTDLVGACEGTIIQASAEEVEIGLRSRTSSLHKAMEELRGQMRTIISSEYGRWLKTEKGGRNIDLYKLTSESDSDSVILFSLNSDSEKDFSKYLGSLILADLSAVSAKRRNNGIKNQISVYVDEFQAVPPTAVTSLLEKSRESKMGMTLSSQSYEQIVAASDNNGEAYLISIMDTCSNFIVHNGATEKSAVRLAEIIGKDFETVYSASNQNDGFLFSINWFNKRNQIVKTDEEERWIVHPKEFMSLSSPSENNGYKSTAVIINKSPDDPLFKNNAGGAVARHVWMIPNQEVINDYYIPKLASDDSYDETDLPPALVELTGKGHNSILEEQEAPRDYLSERLDGHRSTDSIVEEYDYSGMEDEDLDGSFGFETIEEDEDDSFKDVQSIDYRKVMNQRKTNNDDLFESARPKTRRSAIESASFESLFNSEATPDLVRRKESPKSRLPKKPDPIEEDLYEEEALPDIEELM